MTHQQTRTQFNFWAIMASPLIISANIRNMSKENLETYSNEEVIAIDQDPLGIQGVRLVGGNLYPSSSSSADLVNTIGRKSRASSAEKEAISSKRWYTSGFDGSDGPAQVMPCNVSDPHMLWIFGKFLRSTLINAAWLRV